jgi:tRNA threonylcarbamoyladenosine biosynthesis protein TsaE
LSERTLPSERDTERLGADLARTQRWPSARALVVYLQGELGSGKTTLARGLLREMGIAEIVRSPTYTLMERYDSGGQQVLHVDLYRLGAAAEVHALGLRDELGPAVLMLIEWPERAAQGLPPPDVRIALKIACTGRSALLVPESEEGRVWVRALAPPGSESKRV